MLSFLVTFTCVIITHTFLRPYSWISNISNCITWWGLIRIKYIFPICKGRRWEAPTTRWEPSPTQQPSPTQSTDSLHPLKDPEIVLSFVFSPAKRFYYPHPVHIRKRKHNGSGCLNAVFLFGTKNVEDRLEKYNTLLLRPPEKWEQLTFTQLLSCWEYLHSPIIEHWNLYWSQKQLLFWHLFVFLSLYLSHFLVSINKYFLRCN